ncbi:hypothetical protein NQ317_002972 [Molorchus minor]|uniref:Uncharacterized protein n=1 Tax=Molorchus minor TaxID=1323400 RepID=A0ABQ9J7B5_9CUCU|nr:hypothetical protein NQ317_002972 [Molorchus minor]
MDDDSSRSFSDSGSDSDSDQGLPQNYTYFLQSLINSGQVHIMTSDYASEFSMLTKQASGLLRVQKNCISRKEEHSKYDCHQREWIVRK